MIKIYDIYIDNKKYCEIKEHTHFAARRNLMERISVKMRKEDGKRE